MWMRAYAALVLPLANGRRGEDFRELKLYQLLADKLPSVKPAPCHFLAFSIWNTKEGRLEPMETLIPFLPAVHRDRCAVGALSAYLVWMNDLSGTGHFMSVMKNDLLNLKEKGPQGYEPK